MRHLDAGTPGKRHHMPYKRHMKCSVLQPGLVTVDRKLWQRALSAMVLAVWGGLSCLPDFADRPKSLASAWMGFGWTLQNATPETGPDIRAYKEEGKQVKGSTPCLLSSRQDLFASGSMRNSDFTVVIQTFK